MRDYELMVVFDANLDEAATEAASNRVSALVTGRGATLQGVEAWGRRRLAYPIGRHRDGVYQLIRFEAESTVAAELERGLGVMEPVLRHLLVRAGAEIPPPRGPQGFGQNQAAGHMQGPREPQSPPSAPPAPPPIAPSAAPEPELEAAPAAGAAG